MKPHAKHDEEGPPDAFACPLLTETNSHAETPSPPRLDCPSSRHSSVRAESTSPHTPQRGCGRPAQTVPPLPCAPLFFVSCPLCASWFNPPPSFNHEAHQRHEPDPRNPGPSRGPRPGGPKDDNPSRECWVPSPHEHSAPAGIAAFYRFTPRAASDSDGFLTPASLKTQRRQDRHGMKSAPRAHLLCVSSSLRESYFGIQEHGYG